MVNIHLFVKLKLLDFIKTGSDGCGIEKEGGS